MDQIKGILLTPLKKIDHPQGDLFHGIKKGDNGYTAFGEAYFSTIHHGAIKGWKKHKEMTLNLIVPIGSVEFMLYDMNTKAYFSVELSSTNYQRLTVPPGLWVAFKGIGTGINLVLNVADILHNPEEIDRLPLDAIPYGH